MKRLPLILIIIVLVILGAGLIFAKQMNNKGPAATPTPAPEQNVMEKISEDAIDFIFEPRYDKHAFTMTIKGLKEKNYKSFEYEVLYDAQSRDNPSQIISQGTQTNSPVQVTDKPYVKEILLGTESKGVPTYDKGVKSINITLRLTTTSGKTHLWEKEFSLE